MTKKGKTQGTEIRRVQVNDKRHYEIKEDGVLIGVFPSVTSILGSTGDKSGLDRWRERVGEDEAKKIGENSTNRGTVMHRLCELYLNLPHDIQPKDKLAQILDTINHDEEIKKFDTRAVIVGSQLFYNFYHSGSFDKIVKVISQEQFLWNKLVIDGEDLSYAGTVDNFSQLDDGSFKVIDFKTAKKPKNEAWIENYKMQVAAYSIAIWARLKIKPDGGEIWISNEQDRFPQCFMMNFNDIKRYFDEFLKRRREFNAINQSIYKPNN